MNYIKLATMEYPRHQGDIRLEHPDIGDVFVCPETYVHVQDTPEPEISKFQRIEEQFPTQNNGIWERQWAVRDATPEEIEQANKPFDPLKPFGRITNV